MSNNIYYKRIADELLDLKLRAFGTTNIVGPKWCEKTETAKQKAKSFIMLQKDPNKDGLIYTAKVNPMALLNGEKPRLPPSPVCKWYFFIFNKKQTKIVT